MSIIGRFWKKTGEASLNNAPKAPLDVAKSLLSQIKCNVEWQAMGDDMNSGEYNYQGGLFALRVWHSHPYALLVFPHFFSTDLREINVVRSIVNRINMESIFSRVVITASEESYELQCHIMACVTVDEDTPSRFRNLCDAMNHCFNVRRDFDQYFAKAMQAKEGDLEMAAANQRRDLYLLAEQAWAHDKESVRLAPSGDMHFTLNEMLCRVFDWRDVLRIGLRIITGGEIVEVPDAINYEPLDALVGEDGTVLAHDVTLLLDVERRKMDLFAGEHQTLPQSPNVTVVAMMRVISADDQTVYVRVTLAREGSITNDVRPMQHPEMKGDAVTFIIAKDLQDDSKRREEFKYVMKEAQYKLSMDMAEDLTDIQKALLTCDPYRDQDYNLYWGYMYARHRRYPEALAHFLGTYEVMSTQFYDMSDGQKNVFFDVMYNVGMCYARMGMHERAFFYLDCAVKHTTNKNYIVELIDCLVNVHDLRAESVLDNALSRLKEYFCNSDAKDDLDLDTIQPFVRYLNMRRAYLYTEQHRWAEAKKLLRILLKDSTTRDFALNELAYITSVRP